MVVPKPFVKWAGGKGFLLKQLEELLPAYFGYLDRLTYVEPFVGGGAVFFHVLSKYKNIKRAIINDINPDLIHCYRLIAKNPQTLIERLRDIEKNFYHYDVHDRKEIYYAYRDQFNLAGINSDERAALFIFLNHTCFNGLYRVNSAGKFNVPFGQYKHPNILNEDLIIEDHKLLRSVELIIMEGDYKNVEKRLATKYPNFIYFDPPYRPLSETSNFKEYSNSPFGDKQQEELKKFCDKVDKKGCLFMLSNSDSKNELGESYFEDLYEGYDFQRIYAPRFINAFSEKRVKLTEVLIRNYRP